MPASGNSGYPSPQRSTPYLSLGILYFCRGLPRWGATSVFLLSASSLHSRAVRGEAERGAPSWRTLPARPHPPSPGHRQRRPRKTHGGSTRPLPHSHWPFLTVRPAPCSLASLRGQDLKLDLDSPHLIPRTAPRSGRLCQDFGEGPARWRRRRRPEQGSGLSGEEGDRIPPLLRAARGGSWGGVPRRARLPELRGSGKGPGFWDVSGSPHRGANHVRNSVEEKRGCLFRGHHGAEPQSRGCRLYSESRPRARPAPSAEKGRLPAAVRRRTETGARPPPSRPPRGLCTRLGELRRNSPVPGGGV